MPKKCSCKKCTTTNSCTNSNSCANSCCYEITCADSSCNLLVEPCNPCPPQQQTISYCVPTPPCPPCPTYSFCAPNNTSDWLCPQYVINTSTLGGNGGIVNLTNTQVNSYNMFIFNNTSTNTLTVNLPLISTLSNGGKKTINITNMASSTITLQPASSDTLCALTTYSLDANKSAILYSLVGIASGLGGTVWALTH